MGRKPTTLAVVTLLLLSTILFSPPSRGVGAPQKKVVVSGGEGLGIRLRGYPEVYYFESAPPGEYLVLFLNGSWRNQTLLGGEKNIAMVYSYSSNTLGVYDSPETLSLFHVEVTSPRITTSDGEAVCMGDLRVIVGFSAGDYLSTAGAVVSLIVNVSVFDNSTPTSVSLHSSTPSYGEWRGELSDGLHNITVVLSLKKAEMGFWRSLRVVTQKSYNITTYLFSYRSGWVEVEKGEPVKSNITVVMENYTAGAIMNRTQKKAVIPLPPSLTPKNITVSISVGGLEVLRLVDLVSPLHRVALVQLDNYSAYRRSRVRYAPVIPELNEPVYLPEDTELRVLLSTLNTTNTTTNATLPLNLSVEGGYIVGYGILTSPLALLIEVRGGEVWCNTTLRAEVVVEGVVEARVSFSTLTISVSPPVNAPFIAHIETKFLFLDGEKRDVECRNTTTVFLTLTAGEVRVDTPFGSIKIMLGVGAVGLGAIAGVWMGVFYLKNMSRINLILTTGGIRKEELVFEEEKKEEAEEAERVEAEETLEEEQKTKKEEVIEEEKVVDELGFF